MQRPRRIHVWTRRSLSVSNVYCTVRAAIRVKPDACSVIRDTSHVSTTANCKRSPGVSVHSPMPGRSFTANTCQKSHRHTFTFTHTHSQPMFIIRHPRHRTGVHSHQWTVCVRRRESCVLLYNGFASALVSATAPPISPSPEGGQATRNALGASESPRPPRRAR
jgi:hypothetical protein